MRNNLTLSVKRKELITPNYLRVFLTGDGIEKMAGATVGDNNKIQIPPPGVSKVHFQEFDYKKMEWMPVKEEKRPLVRTFTHRGIDLEKNEIWIDFVLHGDQGRASAWVQQAKVGDELHVMMKSEPVQLYGKAQNYLLVGDSAAMPVIGAILEDLPQNVNGICIIEVQSKADEQDLRTKANIDFQWLHNPHPEKGSHLATVVESLHLPDTDRFGYIAGEFNTVKRLRTYLRKEMGWDRDELYAYSFWKAGLAEDYSKQVRTEEKNAVEELKTINSI